MYYRAAESRGHVEIDWLNSYHSFSFGHYYDPAHMGFGVLRVINDDRIAPLGGFPTHGHQDMEIISYGISGSLAHKDSMGNGSVITAGDIQVMSAGTGIQHSEFNPSSTEETHFLQIWLTPATKSVKPRYEEKHFDYERRRNTLLPMVSGNGMPNTIAIHQNVTLYTSLLQEGASLTFNVSEKRSCWLQVAKGGIEVNGQVLKTGDGLGVREPGELKIVANTDTDFLLFDLPN